MVDKKEREKNGSVSVTIWGGKIQDGDKGMWACSCVK